MSRVSRFAGPASIPRAGASLPLPTGPSFSLSLSVVAANAGALGIVCLDARAEGRDYRLHATPHGPAHNLRACVAADGAVEWRTDLPTPPDVSRVEAEQEPGALIRVDVRGPIEERGGYHDPCSGFSIGHDTICASLCAAFEIGDVLLVCDSPGSVVAGLEQNIARALAAKAKHGRRVTVFADETIGSGMYWWAAAIGDEIFGVTRSQIGSIGARGGHASIAGMLAKEGVVFTYFAWPSMGKVALAPELPLSDEGRARGDRDIALIGEAFAQAVIESPIGKRRGLTREMIVALGADVLTGQAAVDAGLCDGIATLEEVTSYALALAETGATTETIMDDDQDTPEDEGAKAMECAGCATMNAAGAKFCNSCGVAMGAKTEDVPPPSSKPMPAPPAAQIAAVKPMPTDASIASIVGASADSPLAVKTAAIKMRHDLDRLRATAAGVTGKASIDEQIGALLAFPERIAKGEQAQKDQRAALAKAEATERAALVKRGVATGAPEMTAGRCYIPRVSADGARTGTDIAPMFAEMKIGTLRGLVEGLEASATPRNPFTEDKAAAKAASDAAKVASGNAPPQLPNGEPTAAQIAAATKHPSVQRMLNAPGNTIPVERLAKHFIIEAAKNGVSIGV